MRKLTIQDMHELAKSRNGFCLSKSYTNSQTKLLWQCKIGHRWETTSNNVKNGKWCPFCAQNARVTIEEMHALAESKGGKFLSEKCIGSRVPHKWQCKEGHIWLATLDNVQRNRWCPKCARTMKGLKRRLTIEQMKAIAESKGGKCLSDTYSINTKLKWKCSKGHIWYAKPVNVKFGRWCHVCWHKMTGKKPLTLEQMKGLAESFGGKCLSDIYENGKTKLTWQCKQGHIWTAIPNNVKRGHWCPVCSQGISERVCHKYFETLFGKKFHHTRPKWLTAENGIRLELDGYNDELKLAFEYQGIQHYSQIKFFGRETNFEKQQIYDRIKQQLCSSNDIVLIQIPYTINLESMGEFIIDQCRKNGINIPSENIPLESLKFSYPEKTKKFQEIAHSKGGKCLSNYINQKTRMKFQCQMGHIWNALSGVIERGAWCPKCAGNARLTLEDMKSLAKLKNGICLSENYVNTGSKLRWQCEKGHVWDATPDSIKAGRWCHKCSNWNRYTIEDMQELARVKNGRCLSKFYVNYDTKLEWQCKFGHVWRTRPENVKRGTWCPECYKTKKIARPRSNHTNLTISLQRT